MFIQLYRGNGGVENGDPNNAIIRPGQQARAYLEAHPLMIAGVIEAMWALRNHVEFSSDIRAFPFIDNLEEEDYWPWHLIYAYMIENTRIYEIFERVIYEYFHGERLGFPSRRQGTNRWLRAAETIF